MQTGSLRDALKVYLTIVERPDAGEQKYIAATNAADVYLTWFDAGRNKERNYRARCPFRAYGDGETHPCAPVICCWPT